MTFKVKRYISWFSKETELLVEQEEFKVPDDILPTLFTPYEGIDDPYFYRPYDVTKENYKVIQTYIKHEIDFDKFDYEMRPVSVK